MRKVEFQSSNFPFSNDYVGIRAWLNVPWIRGSVNEKLRLFFFTKVLQVLTCQKGVIMTSLCSTCYMSLMNSLPVSLSHYVGVAVLMYKKISSRWFGIPGHAPPPAAAHQELQQWDSGPPEDQHHSALGARGPLYPVLLHALPTDGMGEPQRWAFQSHLTDREVSPTLTLEMMLL